MNDIFVSSVFLIVGVGILFVAFIVKQKTNRILTNGVETEGVINGFEDSNNLSNNSKYPIIRFQTKEGTLITEKANIALPPFVLKEGQKVKVVYQVDNPKEFVLKTPFSFSNLFYFFVVIAISFIIIGGFGIYNYLLPQ